MRFLSAILALLAVSQAFSHQVEYDNYKLYRLTPRNEQALKALKKMEETSNTLDFWSSPKAVGHPTDVMIPPEFQSNLENFIRTLEVDAKLIIPNVQEVINSQNVAPRKNLKAGEIDWTAYYDVDEINAWMESLVEKYPKILTRISVGTSYEGREIFGVHLSYNANNSNNAVFIEGNIHAREWITSAVVTWMLNEFLTSTDPSIRSLAERYDWYFVPMFNPDGLAYTHTNERLWRKTRKPYGFCYGADPNRNWGFHWNEGGSSSNPCSETYNGPSAFSEVETKSISEYISTIGTKLVGYIGFHSYSQLLLIPYGHSAEHLENFDQLNTIGHKAAAVLKKRYGTEYTVGNIVETIYVASGGSMDWVKGTFHTPVTYTYELRDTGRYGFLLPADQIIPTGEETLDSIITIFEEYEKDTKAKK